MMIFTSIFLFNLGVVMLGIAFLLAIKACDDLFIFLFFFSWPWTSFLCHLCSFFLFFLIDILIMCTTCVFINIQRWTRWWWWWFWTILLIFFGRECNFFLCSLEFGLTLHGAPFNKRAHLKESSWDHLTPCKYQPWKSRMMFEDYLQNILNKIMISHFLSKCNQAILDLLEAPIHVTYRFIGLDGVFTGWMRSNFFPLFNDSHL